MWHCGKCEGACPHAVAYKLVVNRSGREIERKILKMNNIDKRHILDEEVFTYKVSKDNKIFIFWYGKQVTILKGKESAKFLEKITNANHLEAQLIMAKVTGNFKRGNEKK